jgi:hypothetical protein
MHLESQFVSPVGSIHLQNDGIAVFKGGLSISKILKVIVITPKGIIQFNGNVFQSHESVGEKENDNTMSNGYGNIMK